MILKASRKAILYVLRSGGELQIVLVVTPVSVISALKTLKVRASSSRPHRVSGTKGKSESRR